MFKEFYISHKCEVIFIVQPFKIFMEVMTHVCIYHVLVPRQQPSTVKLNRLMTWVPTESQLANCNVEDTFLFSAIFTNVLNFVPDLPHFPKYALHISKKVYL